MRVQCHRVRFLPLFVLVAGPALGRAGAQSAPPKPVAFTMDLGFVSAQGNSRLTTFNFAERLTVKRDYWQHAQAFGVIYGRTDGQETSNLSFATWRSDYTFLRNVSVYGSFSFDRNKFAGIARRFEQGIGLAWSAVNAGRQQWKVEAGGGVTQQRTLDGETNRFSSVRGATSYRYNFSSSAYAFENLEYLPNLEVSEDYRVNSETGVVAPLSAHLALKVGYVVRFDNLPEPGRRRSDRILTTGLQLNF